MDRRIFLSGIGGAAIASLPAGTLPTASSGEEKPPPMKATEDNILGPYHRKGAPWRAKVCPPLAEGEVLLIKGRIWSLVTRKPLPNTALDIWQADHKGHYDNDGHKKLDPKTFDYRVRLITDEAGYYEYETIMPGRYKIGADTWRPSHIHYMVRHPKHKKLITQLYFHGDPHLKSDRWAKVSLTIKPERIRVKKGHYLSGNFDIVLEGN